MAPIAQLCICRGLLSTMMRLIHARPHRHPHSAALLRHTSPRQLQPISATAVAVLPGQPLGARCRLLFLLPYLSKSRDSFALDNKLGNGMLDTQREWYL